jgi:hypothetical protein
MFLKKCFFGFGAPGFQKHTWPINRSGIPLAGAFFYADFETRTSAWRRPQYVCGDWTRWLSEDGVHAWWCSEALRLFFWELDIDSGWKRYVDDADRMYWSNVELAIRFYEPQFQEPEAEPA